MAHHSLRSMVMMDSTGRMQALPLPTLKPLMIHQIHLHLRILSQYRKNGSPADHLARNRKYSTGARPKPWETKDPRLARQPGEGEAGPRLAAAGEAASEDVRVEVRGAPRTSHEPRSTSKAIL